MKKAKTSNARRKQTDDSNRLILQLEDAEEALQAWIKSSPENADFFRRDPIAAMRAAGLNIDDDIMLELEMITRAIASKLK